jgi:hypothetical protein
MAMAMASLELGSVKLSVQRWSAVVTSNALNELD